MRKILVIVMSFILSGLSNAQVLSKEQIKYLEQLEFSKVGISEIQNYQGTWKIVSGKHYASNLFIPKGEFLSVSLHFANKSLRLRLSTNHKVPFDDWGPRKLVFSDIELDPLNPTHLEGKGSIILKYQNGRICRIPLKLDLFLGYPLNKKIGDLYLTWPSIYNDKCEVEWTITPQMRSLELKK